MSNTRPNTAHQNGYMIRLEVLKMAMEMVEQEYCSRRDTLQAEWSASVEIARQKVSNGYHNVVIPEVPALPEFPSPAEIKAKAMELYQFITTK